LKRLSHSFRIPGIAWALLVAVLFALSVRRAATLPVTHDEALTYLRYVAGDWRAVFGHFDANNHVLHTALCKLIVGTFGLSLGTLRAAGLFGALLFLVAAARIAAVVAGGGLGSAVLFGVAATNPLVVRELSLARGYSLALAFFGLGLLALIPGGFGPSRRESGHRLAAAEIHPAAAGIAFALSTAANLTFLFPCLGAAAGAGWLSLSSPFPRRGRIRAWVRLGLPAAGLAMALLAVPAYQAARRGLARRTIAGTSANVLQTAQKANYYLGEPSTAGSIRTLLGGSLGEAGTTRLAAWLLAFAFAAIAVFLAVGIRWAWRITPRPRIAVLFGSSLFGTAAILALLHVAIGLPLPQARTGLSFLVLFPFAWGASVVLLPSRVRRAAIPLSVLAGAVVVVQYARVASRSDLVVPDSERMIEALQSSAGASASPWRVGASWFVAPNLEFSRRLLRARAVAPIEYREPLCVDDFDAYVLLGKDAALADSVGLDVIFRDARSGAVVAIPTGRGNRAQASRDCPPARALEKWSSGG
jgi:hypothetical protein